MLLSNFIYIVYWPCPWISDEKKFSPGFCPQVSAQDGTSTETAVLDSVSCYACGLDDVDPEKDKPGSFGDAQRNSTPTGKKMYNFTCDIVDKVSKILPQLTLFRKARPFSDKNRKMD